MANDTKVKVGVVRFTYAHVFEGQPDDNGKVQFSSAILIPKKDKASLKTVNDAIAVATAEGKVKWGKLPAKVPTPLRDGDEYADEKEGREEYRGHMFMNAKTATRPGVVGRDLKPIMSDDAPDGFFSGCYGYVSLNFYPYDFKGKKGIGCGLNNIMKTKGGDEDRLGGGRVSAESDFADLAVEDDDLL